MFVCLFLFDLEVFVQVTDAVTAPHQLHFEFGGFFVFGFVGYRGPSRDEMMMSAYSMLLGINDHFPLLLEVRLLVGEVLTMMWRLVMSSSRLLSGRLVPEM